MELRKNVEEDDGSGTTQTHVVRSGATGKKVLASHKVYKAVKGMIGANRFEAGLRINVEKLARELGVSRGPAWEAIRRLEQEKIVQTIPNRGVFMMESDLEQILEMVEVRSALDRLATLRACGRVSARKLRQLAKQLRDQLQAIQSEDLVRYSSADLKFHGLIYETCGNSYLRELFESSTLRMFPGHINPIAVLPAVYLTHQEIVDGLARQDREAVELAVIHHGELMVNHVRELIEARDQRQEMVQHIMKKTAPFSRVSRKDRASDPAC